MIIIIIMMMMMVIITTTTTTTTTTIMITPRFAEVLILCLFYAVTRVYYGSPWSITLLYSEQNWYLCIYL